GFGWHIQDETISCVYYNGTFQTAGTTTDYLTADTDRDTLFLSIYSVGDGNVYWYVNGTQVATTASGPTGVMGATLPSIYCELQNTGVAAEDSILIGMVSVDYKP